MMISEGAGELNSTVGAATAAAVLPRPTNIGARTTVPIILSATESEATGARMQVGGLRVVDRAIRLLARLRDVHVVIAADGSVPVPRRLPHNMERREIDGDVTAGIARLRAELGPEVVMVGADHVWLQPARFDKGTRVVDAASRRLATEAVFREAQRETVGIVDRLLNQKIASRLTQLLLVHLPAAPALLTLIAGFVGVYGALMVATGSSASVLTGFVILEGFAILDGCAGELARVRLHQTAFGAWLDTVVGDFVNVVMILAVGFALWRHGGTYLDMKMALVAAAMTLFYVAVSYRELMRQGEGDVMKLRWWFAYGQMLKNVSGAGSTSIRAVMLLGRRDVVIVLAIGLAYFDQLPVVLIYLMIIAFVRAAGALGQLLTPDWRARPPQ
jgi:phosphatidylglycerophosphate synthase